MRIKTTMKRMLVLASAILLIFCFIACGEPSAATGVHSDNATTAVPVTVQEADAPQPTAEAASPQQTVETEQQRIESTESPESTEPIQQPPQPQRDTLVIVFSATGTTKRVAELIAGITDADLYEILAAEPYSDADLNWNDRNSRTTKEMNDPNARPEIGSEDISLAGYTTVYIGYPIWWGDAPRIMSTFVEAHDFDGITVIPFCTSASSGIGRSGKNLAAQAGSGTWLDGKRFSGSVTEAELKNWIDSMN